MKALNTVMGLALAGLAILALGTAVAMWYETLLVNTYVETGEVKVAWVDWQCSDTGSDPQLPESNFHNDEGKDVAQCIVEPEVYDEDENVVKVNITLVNAYPGYNPVITLTVENIGTIPVKLLNYSFNGGYDNQALNVIITVPEDTQLHSGGTHDITINITVLQTASEDSTYSFELEFTYAQWNEVP
ncbi:hypothetical protein [Desulfurococcus amylolyticus]|uniref:Uncharacterized protein n=1 Tax=Desulfurococcus amylolyticus DSM 16532 TaxID=768672 RepID=I3XS68_DESAM|nr:hypothetical protein [Desulfurococcus amylolyticus]AFL66792.1 hypothetical protein Desfe_0904 [Desulfurococcus amylolyticus DSM 16532]